MKIKPNIFLPFIFLLLIFSAIGLRPVLCNTIIGTVYDNRKNPLVDVDIELLDDLSRTRNRTRTSDNGRYEFMEVPDGRFTVRVLPFRYNFAQQEQSVELSSVSAIPGQNGTVTEIRDFYLVSKKASSGGELDSGSVVFAQEVPEPAKALYEKAVDALSNKKTEEGLAGLQQAIKIFPNYFLALQALGKEYFIKEMYAEAVPPLIKAADINNKSPLTFYALGYSLNKLGYHKAAIVSLKQAAVLSPSSASVLCILGTAERLDGSYTEAESHLKQANKLSKTPLSDVHWQLALLYGENLKRYSEAADELERFLKVSPAAKDSDKIKLIIKNYRDKSKR